MSKANKNKNKRKKERVEKFNELNSPFKWEDLSMQYKSQYDLLATSAHILSSSYNITKDKIIEANDNRLLSSILGYQKSLQDAAVNLNEIAKEHIVLNKDTKEPITDKDGNVKFKKGVISKEKDINKYIDIELKYNSSMSTISTLSQGETLVDDYNVFEKIKEYDKENKTCINLEDLEELKNVNLKGQIDNIKAMTGKTSEGDKDGK